MLLMTIQQPKTQGRKVRQKGGVSPLQHYRTPQTSCGHGRRGKGSEGLGLHVNTPGGSSPPRCTHPNTHRSPSAPQRCFEGTTADFNTPLPRCGRHSAAQAAAAASCGRLVALRPSPPSRPRLPPAMPGSPA